MTIKSVHLSMATTKRNSHRYVCSSGLNVRVNGNARSLSLFSRSDVASTFFTTGLFMSH